MENIGNRVGAILSADQEEVKLLGYGVYEGDEIPSAEISEMLNFYKIPNPKIKLDNGDIVWGFQCWWGSEEKIKESIGDRKVTIVTIND